MSNATPDILTDPFAFHDLVVVNPTSDAVVRLRGYDLDGEVVCVYHVVTLILIIVAYS